MTFDAHAAVVLARLRSSGSPALTVHDGKVPGSPALPYVLVYFTLITPAAELAPDKVALTFDSDVLDLQVYCHEVGSTAASPRALATRVRAALLNWTPTVSGRACFPVRHVDSYQPQRDESTGVAVFSHVDVYQLVTVPG